MSEITDVVVLRHLIGEQRGGAFSDQRKLLLGDKPVLEDFDEPAIKQLQLFDSVYKTYRKVAIISTFTH